MGWSDRLSDMAGRALGALGSVAFDSFAKAGEAMAQNERAQEEIRKEGMPEATDQSPRSLFYDPFAVIDSLGYKDRPSGLTYNTLAEMSRQAPIISAIHQTRIRQVGNFATPQSHDRDPGFQIRLRDKNEQGSRGAQKKARAMERWIFNTGSTHAYGKDNFEVFLQKYVRDSLSYDQGCYEIVDNRKGLPSDFYAVDGATMRIADVPIGAELDDDPERVRYVQVYDETVIAEFAAHELCFGVRNPRTGIKLNGYGFSELEQMLQTVTAMLWAFEYNRRFFSQGSVTKGILNFRGSIPDSKLDAFRRHWYQMISGVANAWRTPVVNAEELQYVNLHSSNRDMEFSAWMDFLIKISSAIYQFDPAEINFVYGNTGQNSSMFQAPAESRIKSSKDRGLRPLLRHIASNLNRYMIWRIDPDFELVFTGLDPRDSQQIVDTEKKQVTYLKTVDEVRAENDLEPLPDGKGEVILDPTWLQWSQAKEMAEQGFGDEEGDGFGGEDDEGDDEDGPPKNGKGDDSGGSPFESMLSQLRSVEPKEEAAQKSLRKARVTEHEHEGLVTYTLEF